MKVRFIFCLLLGMVLSLTIHAQEPVPVVKDSSERKDVLIYVEQMPEYPGGTNELMKFLSTNIIYPDSARINDIQGKVVVQFIVNKNGSLSDIKIVKGIGSGCDEEVIRVLNMMPRWKPGEQDGQAVSVMFNLPVSFKLDNESPEKKDSIINYSEEFPSFPGGSSELLKFIDQNLQYPAEARKKKIEGKVYIEFIIDEEGSIISPKIKRGLGHGCDEEAIRIVQLMPIWNPGLQNGKPVKILFSLPITFELSNR